MEKHKERMERHSTEKGHSDCVKVYANGITTTNRREMENIFIELYISRTNNMLSITLENALEMPHVLVEEVDSALRLYYK